MYLHEHELFDSEIQPTRVIIDLLYALLLSSFQDGCVTATVL